MAKHEIFCLFKIEMMNKHDVLIHRPLRKYIIDVMSMVDLDFMKIVNQFFEH